MNYYSFADAGICRRTLTALPGKQPFEQHINQIMDYSFYWFIALRDYLLFTGDSGFIGKIYPTAKAFMDFCLSQSNENLLMYNKPHDWIFVDRADMEKEGALCVEQILFCAALKSMAEIASAAGKAQEAEHYTGLSKQLTEEIIRIYRDDDKGCFIHSIGDYGVCTDITRYANISALMYSLVDGDKCRKIAENVLKNDDVPPVGTPYARFYELDALCAAGEHRYVLDEMRSYWGGMLELGATSFREKFSRNDSGAAHYEMYDRPFGKSLCHAWGASPLYLLGKHFLGVTPSENGFSRFAARPQLCDPEYIEGSVPVSGGSVHIFASRDEIRIKSDSAPGVLYFESKKSPTASCGEIKKRRGVYARARCRY